MKSGKVPIDKVTCFVPYFFLLLRHRYSSFYFVIDIRPSTSYFRSANAPGWRSSRCGAALALKGKNKEKYYKKSKSTLKEQKVPYKE